MTTINEIKTPLPCRHVWVFHHNLDQYGLDDYFECEHCHKQAPYCPEDLADIEQEMNNGT